MPDYRLGRLKGQFVVVWEEGGKRRRYRLGALNPGEARAALREFIRQRDSRLIGREKSQSIEAIWNAYIADRQAEGKVSVSRMGDAWKRLAPHFAGLVPDDVNGDSVRAYTASRRAKHASDGTIHTELGYLRAALRRTLKGRAPDIQLPPKPRPRTRHLTPDEARRLIDAAQMPHVRLFIALALHTAARPSSILDLSWDRCDFAGRRIYLDNPDRDRTAKGRATVPMAEPLVGLLKAAKEAALTEFVIEWAGKRVGSVKKSIQRTAVRAGMDAVTPYVLRRTAAVWMAQAGVPMSEICQFLGHTTTSVTERVYARYGPDHLRKASEAISTALSGGGEPDTVNRASTKEANTVNSDNEK